MDGWRRALGSNRAQCLFLARTKRLPGFQWIFLIFIFTPPFFFFLCFLGVWAFPEDAGAVVDPVLGAGAFGKAGAEVSKCLQRLILCWAGSGGSFCHTWSIPVDPSPGGTGEQSSSVTGRAMSPSETIKLHLINPTASLSAGCCFAHFQGIWGCLDCPGHLEEFPS